VFGKFAGFGTPRKRNKTFQPETRCFSLNAAGKGSADAGRRMDLPAVRVARHDFRG